MPITQLIQSGHLAIDNQEPFFIITQNAFLEIIDPTQTLSVMQNPKLVRSKFLLFVFRMLIKIPLLCRIITGTWSIHQAISDMQFMTLCDDIRDILSKSMPLSPTDKLRFSVIDSPTLFASENPPISYTGYQDGRKWRIYSTQN